jgi:AcrR family transcriptional regulator
MLVRTNMNTSRSYSMTKRSAAAEATRLRILGAVLELATEKLSVEIVLADVAARAGVTVQTILRQFGSRDGLFDAALEFGAALIGTERETPVGDIDNAIDVIVAHYELRGDWVIALLGQEASDERIRRVTTPGKALHREWVSTVFAPQLRGRNEVAAAAAIDLLVVATDVYTWKLLRRDRGLDRDATRARMAQLVLAVLATTEEGS